MPPEFVFIINPAAAHGRVGSRRRGVEARILGAFPRARILWTSGPRHATELAAALGRAVSGSIPDAEPRPATARLAATPGSVATPGTVVVACGGDGTVHEVASGLVEAGGSAALAVLGIGTGNDLARSLGMGRGLDAGLDALARSVFGRMDYLRVITDRQDGPRMAFNNVGAGFDAHASELGTRYKGLPGSMGYTAGIFHALVTWDGPPAIARVHGHEASVDLMFVTVGNGHSSGGGYLLTPDANPFDGRLDVCLVSRLGALRSLRMMPRTRRGTHREEPEVTMLQGSWFEFESDRPVPLHCDGEVLPGGCTRLRIEVVPSALPVYAPVITG